MKNDVIALPAPMEAYSAGGAWTYIDRTGVIYQQIVGRQTAAGDWGIHIWRTKPGQKSELVAFAKDANGGLLINNKKLFLVYTGNDKRQYEIEIAGFVYWDDIPSATVIDINENQVALLKQEIATARTAANSAMATANAALKRVDEQRVIIDAMNAKITRLENTVLNRQQIEDIVWAKIWDVNYLIRMGFLQGDSAIQQVRDYLHDLAVYIRRVMK
jgi:hypothetical protein